MNIIGLVDGMTKSVKGLINFLTMPLDQDKWLEKRDTAVCNMKIIINPKIEMILKPEHRIKFFNKCRDEWKKEYFDPEVIKYIIDELEKYIDNSHLEEWRLVGAEHPLYAVSNIGRVKNITSTKSNSILRTNVHGDYPRVSIYDKDKNKKDKFVHVLVANLFCENPLNKPSVDHINRIKTDNSVINLRFATYKEQQANVDKTNIVKANGFVRSIVQLKLDDNTHIKTWRSTTEIEEEFKISRLRITRALAGKFNSTGFNWMYIEDYEEKDPNELWKEIPYPHLKGYFASSNGRIKNPSGKISTSSKDKDGYIHVGIVVDSNYIFAKADLNYIAVEVDNSYVWVRVSNSYLVHKLVADTFHGLPKDTKLIVNHKDGIKNNNREENLEFVTVADNNKHARENNLTYTKEKRICPVRKLTLKGEYIETYKNPASAADANFAIETDIVRVCNGLLNSHTGFKWEYDY